ncbi:MAG: Glu-tRNA(Gln) amidotransferase subunit GatE [Candidatus Atribacteria bacterium]|nr:MAG: Glu-tRNA(Gln) amidotransferase subunit GatE [Candidatus Atribacteria bacterium]
MSDSDNPANVYEVTQASVGYVPREQATQALYEALGFRCGLEVHQQLKTDKKLFCRCPAGIYQTGDNFDAQLVRHMRPTLSELGEYDGTALMEFKTRKNITYRLKGETACTYDIDDTPPFAMNRDALAIATEVALLLGAQIVGELHITRKQYLDGSIPTGFQRTAIVGIHGEIPLPHKTVRVLQLSIEEDSCREVSDKGHERVYSTDRLGMPLIETVTYPDLLTPDEAAQAAQHIRFINRSTGKMNTGIGAGREDVNVSIEGGTRIEIKGVQRIRWIPELTHNEAFRQKALLDIRAELHTRTPDATQWTLQSQELDPSTYTRDLFQGDIPEALHAINLPGFAGILSFFTNPGRCFADEISDRIKVVACIEKPNMLHSEEAVLHVDWTAVRNVLSCGDDDAQILIWGPQADIPTAIETVEERCQMAFEGVPNETRKALADGTTIFERVLPGPDRMYPDTDSAPIPIDDARVEAIRAQLPPSISHCLSQLRAWEIPQDCWPFILKRNLFGLLKQLIDEQGLSPVRAGTLIGHTLRRISGDQPGDCSWIPRLARELRSRDLSMDLLKILLPAAFASQESNFEALLKETGYVRVSAPQLQAQIPFLKSQFIRRPRRQTNAAMRNWIMGQLREQALGNVSLADLSAMIDEGVTQ